jgi:hypothetical protein
MANAPTQAISQVGAVRDRSDMQGVEQPGALTYFSDNTAIFTGNGSTTYQDVTSLVLGFMGKNDEDMARLAQSADAARFGAQLIIQQNSSSLAASPGDAVPRGQKVDINQSSLKALLKPFATDEGLEKLSSALEAMAFGGGGGSSGTNVVTGNVQSRGLVLPVR